MPDPGDLLIDDFDYELPEELIAQFPLPERDASRLLICRDGNIREDTFTNIGDHLPGESLLVFNDTRVIRARLVLSRPTGARIEVFCLEPVSPEANLEKAFLAPSGVVWKCLVGNLKRWKSGPVSHEFVLSGQTYSLNARYVADCGDGSHHVSFAWDPPGLAFSTILELNGRVPLPPYIHRDWEPLDATRYQTIYACHEGSVAAPTAGLHFTDGVIKKLESRKILSCRLTLHVGVGTFKPVTVERISGHVMHHEQIIAGKNMIRLLLESLKNKRNIIAVGTTSARTLESLYWTGAFLAWKGGQVRPVSQWDPYNEEGPGHITATEALEALLRYLDQEGREEYAGDTSLMIIPGYSYRLVNGLITNFHMPKSTLLLLVAALIGDNWKKAYSFALANRFRFLSYGDACLFFKTAP